jgi:hypothetical protein
MNPNYTEFRFPQIKAHPWHKVFICSIMYIVPFYIQGIVIVVYGSMSL